MMMMMRVNVQASGGDKQQENLSTEVLNGTQSMGNNQEVVLPSPLTITSNIDEVKRSS